MSSVARKNNNKEEKLTNIINLLSFLSNVDDVEVIKMTIESVIESLQEINNRNI